jgi:hypothetical protein
VVSWVFLRKRTAALVTAGIRYAIIIGGPVDRYK